MNTIPGSYFLPDFFVTAAFAFPPSDAILDRSWEESFLARAGPPFLPPFDPRDAAAELRELLDFAIVFPLRK